MEVSEPQLDRRMTNPERQLFESVWPRPSSPEQQYLDAAIRCGDLGGARSFVENLTPEIRQKITEDSSLMLTALQENEPEFIRFLVEECSAELEKSVMKPVMNEWVRDSSITPLRYAARFKKTEAVLELTRLGASVNAVSPNSRLTALYEACEYGAIVIVRHLIRHGADLAISDTHGKTALMYSVYHVAVCRELIDNGVDVNATDNFGNTALHLAAQKNTETAKLLLENGADLLKKNNKGEDALCIACMHRAIDILKAMRNKLSDNDVGHQALIRSHQLLGACYIDYLGPVSARRSVEVLAEWEAAVRLREGRRHVITGEDDIVSTPNSAYDNAVEVDSMLKFDEMRQDANKICMQGLLLLEKILGPTHRKTIESVIYLVEFYLVRKDYGRALRLQRHGFKLTCDRRVDSTKSCEHLSHLAYVCISYIATVKKQAVNETVDFDGVCEFLEAVTLEAKHPRQLSTKHSRKANGDFMRITLFLIKLSSGLETNAVQISQFRRLLSDFVRLNLRSFDGQTVLMNPIWLPNATDPGFFSYEVDIIKLLLECGADTWETDDNGNSVLHLLAESKQYLIPASRTERKVAEMLLEFGAHFDARNNAGINAADYLLSLGFDISAHTTLQCLAAQVVRRHKIPCEGILPKLLIDFVQMH